MMNGECRLFGMVLDSSSGGVDVTFDEWLTCKTADWDNCELNDYSELYDPCYFTGENCPDPNWYQCYWYPDECGTETGEGEGITFEDWITCWT